MIAPYATVSRRYGGVAMSLHWLSAALVVALLATGLVMTRLAVGSAEQFALYQLHKSLGVSLLLLAVVRCVWRAFNPPPPWPDDMHHHARRAARLMHAVLYVCLVAVPLVGWALVSASTFNIPTRLFGLVTWPHLPILSDLAPASRALIEPVVSRVHAALAYALAGLVLLHSAAALWHGSPVLARMMPGWLWRGGER